MRYLKILLIAIAGLVAAYNLRMLQLRMRARQVIVQRFGHVIDHLTPHAQWVGEFGQIVTIEHVDDTYVHYQVNGEITYASLSVFCYEYRPLEPVFGG